MVAFSGIRDNSKGKKSIIKDEEIDGTTYKIWYDEKPILIWIKIHGVLNADIWKQIALEAEQISSNLGCNKLVYDMTDTILRESTFGLYDIASNLRSLGFERNNKTAFIYSNNKSEQVEIRTKCIFKNFKCCLRENSL